MASVNSVKCTDESMIVTDIITAVVLLSLVTVTDTVSLMCYLLNGHIVVFTVPSLKPLIDVDFIPSPNVRSVAYTTQQKPFQQSFFSFT